MKSKKLLFTTLLSLFGMMSLTILTSTDDASQGVMGAAGTTNSCGGTGCHGSTASASTTLTLTGIPASGYVPGTVYPLTFTIAGATNKPKSGFDLKFSAGTISGNPANTMVMGGVELHHTAPLTASAGVTTVNFNWTAPSDASITFQAIGNAVNNNGNASNDSWNTLGMTFNKEAPASITNAVGSKISVYPNPSFGQVNFIANQKVLNVFAYNLSGDVIALNFTINTSNECTILTNNLIAGNYLLVVKGEKENFHSLFMKQ
jgi:hypothetical protein